MKKFLLALLLLNGSWLFAQNINYDVRITAVQRTNYSDCTGCGNPDPTWKIRATDNVNAAVSQVCIHIPDNNTIFTPVSVTLRSQTNTAATTLTLGLDAFEKNCNNDNCNYYSYSFSDCFLAIGSVYGDDNRCNNSTLGTINIRQTAPCVWNADTSAWCGNYRFIYEYRWNFVSPPGIAVQPAPADNVLCAGSALTLSVSPTQLNGWNTAANYQWQVSTQTDCGLATNWADAGGANSTSFTVPQTPGTRLYRAVLTANCTNNFISSSTASNCIRVAYQPYGVPGDLPPAIQSGICGSTVLPGSTHTLNTLQPPAVGGITNVTGYSWAASAGAPVSGSGNSFQWTAPVTPGTYSVSLTYQDNCPSPDATVTCVVNVGSPNCDFAYVSTSGLDIVSAGGPENPYASLTYALTQLNGRTYIRMAEGTYSEGIIDLQSNITIEGGYRVVGNVWSKRSDAVTELILSGFQDATVTGTNDVEHRVGLYGNNDDNWVLQDLHIQTTDITGVTPSNRGRSNYAMLLLNGCENYQIIRTQLVSGNASSGAPGTTPSPGGGATGGSGAGAGGNGSNGCGDPSGGQNGNAGTAAPAGGPPYVFPAGANGGPGSGGSGSDNCGSGGFACSGCDGNDGIPGTPGLNGSSWQVGDKPTVTIQNVSYFVPAGQSASGQNGGGGGQGAGGNGSRGGTCAFFNNDGKNGGTGGAGGTGGTGGTGGFGAGGSFAIYRFNSSNGATLTNVSLATPATPAAGGDGASGSAGLSGSNGSSGSCNNSACTVRCSGDGGRGGNGGFGGRGRDGADGVNAAMVTDGVPSDPSSVIPVAPTITVEYQNTKACIHSEITITKAGGVWSLPAGLQIINDLRDQPAGLPVSSYTTSNNTLLVSADNPSTAYSITIGGSTFNQFLRTTADNRRLPQIQNATRTICIDGSVTLAADTWGTQVEYDWRIYQGTNVNSPIFTSTLPSPTAFLTGIPAGLYTIRYRVREICCGWSKPVYDTLRIAPLPIIFNVGGGGNICPGSAGVPITLSGSEPSVTYELLLNGAPVDTMMGTGGPIAFPTQNALGVYTIRATRFTACGQMMFGNVTIGNAPLPFPFDVRGGGEICQSGGVSSREIRLTGSEPGVSYQLYLNGTTPIGLPVPGTGLQLTFGQYSTAGFYKVIGTYTNTGCSGNMLDSAVISVRTGPTAYSVSGGGGFCPGSPGAPIRLSSSQNGYYYEALLSNVLPLGDTAIGNGGLLQLGNFSLPGSYSVRATDSIGCQTLMLGQARVFPLLLPDIGTVRITPISCNGRTDGSIVIQGSSTNGSLSYSIDSGITFASSGAFNALAQGFYQVVIRDDSNCVRPYAVNPVEIAEPQPLQIQLERVDSIRCFNDQNGAVAISVIGGTPVYTYQWNNGSSSEDVNNLSAGAYVVTVTDSRNCTASQTATLNQPPSALTVTANSQGVSCFGNGDGQINLQVSGGGTPYQYQWSDIGLGINQRTGLSSGVIDVTVSDAYRCEIQRSFNISEPDTLTVDLNINLPDCNGNNSGSAVAMVSGGSSPFTYNWSTVPAQTGVMASNLGNGNYTLTVTDANQCTATRSFTITDPSTVTVTTVPVNVTCFSGNNGRIEVTASGGTGNYTYSINGLFSSSNVFTGLGAGNYIVVATDNNGCSGSALVSLNDAAGFRVNAGPDQLAVRGMPVELTATASSQGSTIIGYYWSPNIRLSCVECQTTVASPDTTTHYVVMAMDADSCSTFDTVVVEVRNGFEYFVPNTFSPNGDGLNDYFEMDILGAINLDVRIYNRWGEEVFHNPSQKNGLGNADGWNGEKGGKELQMDSYMYQILISFFDGSVETINGTVTLIR